jgi:superfamily II DNA helicase RecQ
MDLAVLLRHALWSIRTGDTPASTWVPVGDGWPDARDWEEAGLRVVRTGDRHRLVLEAWRPSWLESSNEIESGDAAAHALMRRPSPELWPADPFFQRSVGLKNYSSPGQREAVRALALAPDGGTVIANLPTGSGKSAVAYSVAATKARTSPAVAIVVVPTTALALDQDRAFREVAHQASLPCPDVLAYHGGLPQQAKDDLRRRVRGGSQSIVFTSPESLLGGLRAAVFDAARHGAISLFAVDEAHVAVAWGEEFRPEFQLMAPLRDQLLALQRAATNGGFPTLLMSGTLTAAAIDRLQLDFGRSSPVEVVSAVALRPEPEYWIAERSDRHERERRVLEALAHLPRPAILYTTRPVHADEWFSTLRARGYRRTIVVHGGTSETQRQEAMAGMKGTALGQSDDRTTVDLVVGTSAYGLGVDQPDVRTIVHACLPESLDRYYQEVGRSGRDGRASVSVLIPAFEDWNTARSLAQDAIITVGKAQERWKAMRNTSAQAEGGGRRVKLGQVPAYLFRESDTNAAWNLRTLLLLQQAGVLRIRLEEPPRRSANETDEAWDARLNEEWDRQRTSRVIELLVGDFESEELWQVVEKTRRSAASRGIAGFDAMAQAMLHDDDLAAAFAREYSVRPGHVTAIPELGVHVARACGGCPACRRARSRVARGYIPNPQPPAVPDPMSKETMKYFTQDADLILVLVDDWREPRVERRMRRAVTGLIGHGLGALVAPAAMVDALYEALAMHSVIVSTAWQPTGLPDITTAVIAVDPNQEAIPVQDVLRLGPPRVVFVDPELPDPEWPHQQLRARAQALMLDGLLEVL